MSKLKDILIRRDDMTEDEANEAISEAKMRVYSGENPENILLEEFGLEPDYIFDLLD